MDKKYSNVDYLYILYNILQILEDRGYLYLGTNYEKIKNDKEKIDENIDFYENKICDYISIIKNNKYNIIAKNNNNYILLLFLESFYTFENNIDINYIFKNISSYFTNHVYWQKIIKVYIICPDQYEDHIKKKIKKEGIDIFESMVYTKLLYNPTQHIYFSKHEKVKNYEKKYKKYDLKLPILLKNDISSEWYDYKINDIIKITREDKKYCYRIVKKR
jgi:DNA-directed RNA polymerase subunit H (RpoH/RPB5)